MHFIIYKNDEEFIVCKNKTELYIEWNKIVDDLNINHNFEHSIGFYMQSRTKDQYIVKRTSRLGIEEYNNYDRDEYYRLIKKEK